MAQPPPPPGWYADPGDPSRQRWWDGTRWTEKTQPPAGQAPAASGGSGPLWADPTLWVISRARVGGWSAEVRDQSGGVCGSLRQSARTIRLFDGAGAPQLQLHTEYQRRWSGWSGVLGFDVLHPSGSPYGELDVDKYLNKRVTLSLRSGQQQLAVLASEDKSDDRFAIHDNAGSCLARVHKAQQGGSLFKEDLTWWLSMARPLSAPLDALVLAAGTALSAIQHLVVNLHDVDVR